MANYRTLLIAPPSDLLSVDNEVQQVNNLLGAKLLQGDDANIIGVLHMMANTFDIVWFATHGDERGVELKDGIFSTSEITTLARSVGAKLIVLNTCSSRSVALSIYDETGIPVVCTIKQVPDRTAFFTGAVFARRLSEGVGFREAYESAKPGQNSTYSFVPEEKYDYAKETVMSPPEQPRSRTIEEDISSLVTLVRRLEIIVTGNKDYNVDGLVPTVKQLNDKVERLLSDFLILRANQIFNRRLLFGISFLSVLLLVAVVILVYQRWGT